MSADVLPGPTVPVRRLDERVRRYQGIVHLAGPEEVFALDEVAEFIWRRIDGRRTIADLGADLAAEYDIDVGEACNDVADLITELVSHGAIAIAGPPPT
ncbi:PqqD family protein [Actinoplanes sp. NPDC051475]|uniref:PqqD family protein n=1 Tax=Actinoplanes sp. NPDC051475 TaxID=3157225 RepID=UPI0034509AB8